MPATRAARRQTRVAASKAIAEEQQVGLYRGQDRRERRERRECRETSKGQRVGVARSVRLHKHDMTHCDCDGGAPVRLIRMPLMLQVLAPAGPQSRLQNPSRQSAPMVPLQVGASDSEPDLDLDPPHNDVDDMATLHLPTPTPTPTPPHPKNNMKN